MCQSKYLVIVKISEREVALPTMISRAAHPFGAGLSGTAEPVSEGNIASFGSNIWSGSEIDFRSALFWHFPVPAIGVPAGFGGDTGAWASTLVAAATAKKGKSSWLRWRVWR